MPISVVVVYLCMQFLRLLIRFSNGWFGEMATITVCNPYKQDSSFRVLIVSYLCFEKTTKTLTLIIFVSISRFSPDLCCVLLVILMPEEVDALLLQKCE